ncbi:hypothetical protein CFI10_13780 [Marinobacterium iners]|uniref:PilW family protein n=1 Tax=Marinobacterium iners TaxID=48076 RepID=UPI001A907F5D|nr:prepilin-type N-terminal cleavage/methylation domain-containing protein [Marinobacterium iners]QSR36051.1 hypothetical protein CFI10_13780 [Marinobacterium iners]
MKNAERLCCKGKKTSGFSLIELMVAMVIGLVILGAVLSVFLVNTRSMETTENLSKLQEGARAAFEIMSRQLREVAPSSCFTSDLSGAGSGWWDGLDDELTPDLTGFADVGNSDVLQMYTSAPGFANSANLLSRNCSLADGLFEIALFPVAWFVGCTDGAANCAEGDRSLFISRVSSAGNALSEPVMDGVVRMEIQRLRYGSSSYVLTPRLINSDTLPLTLVAGYGPASGGGGVGGGGGDDDDDGGDDGGQPGGGDDGGGDDGGGDDGGGDDGGGDDGGGDDGGGDDGGGDDGGGDDETNEEPTEPEPLADDVVAIKVTLHFFNEDGEPVPFTHVISLRNRIRS